MAANVFSSDVDNLIAYDAATGAPGNVNAAAIQGLELQLDAVMDAWKAGGALTLLSAEQEGGTYDGKALPRRPGEFLELRLERAFASGSAGVSVYSAGSTYDDLANTRVINSYTTIDVRGAYHLSANWRLLGQGWQLDRRRLRTCELLPPAWPEFFCRHKMDAIDQISLLFPADSMSVMERQHKAVGKRDTMREENGSR